MNVKTVTAGRLKGLLNDGGELALIDVREQGVYVREHLLFATCMPLSRLELLLDDLIPRRSVRIVVCDGGAGDAGLAQRAAARLEQFGYSDIAVLEDGVEGWRKAGYELFSGINVPSKAFGEYVEQVYNTPQLSAGELQQKIAAGEKLIILDSRPLLEYRRMNIPGGIDCPGAELVYRVHDQAPDPDTLVVVNCAGRTRSIIGAQSLINAGIKNRAMALENGTMGWRLAGLELEYAQDRQAPAPSVRGEAAARACAARVAKRFGVNSVDRTTLSCWRRESAERTLYLLDVRTPEEYLFGHLLGSRSAPGGQLVQATDEYLAVRNARIVLVDDTEVRATMTASWLLQMGWDDVFVLQGGISDETLLPGPHRPRVLGFQTVPTLTVYELKALLDGDTPVAVFDLATSLEHRRGHIPGARWVMRSRLEAAFDRITPFEIRVLTSPDGLLAHLAARDIEKHHPQMDVRVLEDGTRAWLEAGLPLAEGLENALCEADDVWYKPYEHAAAVEQAMRDYLQWEVDLPAQIERDGDARFRRFDN